MFEQKFPFLAHNNYTAAVFYHLQQIFTVSKPLSKWVCKKDKLELFSSLLKEETNNKRQILKKKKKKKFAEKKKLDDVRTCCWNTHRDGLCWRRQSRQPPHHKAQTIRRPS